jgi:DNA polymerase III delta prime subunit
MSNEFLYVEKYRPRTVEECILPNPIKKVFKKIVKSGEIPNMLFTGSAGVGKTTIAKALCNELGLDYILINGSDEGRKIDTVRDKIRSFASSVSLQGGYKVVILDEADYLNADSVQPALRGFIEEFSNNCRFILTCNFKNKIIAPLHSRCSVYEFSISNKDKPELAGQFFKRVTQILKEENIEFVPEVVAQVITKYFPDWRRVLNELQRYAITGKIDAGLLVNLSDSNIKDLMKHLKTKDFKSMRQWVVNNIDSEPQTIFRNLYDNMMEYIQPQSIPQLVLLIADYQYKNSFVADAEINLVACMTEIMSSVEFK